LESITSRVIPAGVLRKDLPDNRPGRGLATYVSEKLIFTAYAYSIKELFLLVQLYYPPLVFNAKPFSTRPGTAVNEIDNPSTDL
jgi:hypothetical protein